MRWLCLALCLLATDAAAARRMAVVVGANAAAPGRTQLRYAHVDAESVAQALVEVADFTAEEIDLLLDPTPEEVMAALDRRLAMLSGLREETMLLFYYSGHADHASLYPGGTPLPLAAIKERLSDEKASVRVGIVDACSGGGWTGSKGLHATEQFEIDLPLALANVLLVDRLALALDRGVTAARLALGCGALAGLGALTRPGHVFFAGLFLLYVLVRRRGTAAAALMVGLVLLIAPWTARNYAVYGRPVLIASEGGITFWTGNHPLAIGEGDLAANPAIKRDNLRVRAAHPGWTPEELEPVYYREALASIAAAPLRWLTLLPRKVFYLFVPVGPSYTLHSSRYLVASVASWGLLLPMAIAGLVVLGQGGRLPRGVLLLAASAVAASLVFFPQERFRLSGLDPAALVLAAGALALATAPRRPPTTPQTAA